MFNDIQTENRFRPRYLKMSHLNENIIEIYKKKNCENSSIPPSHPQKPPKQTTTTKKTQDLY
jgi:hypothetical protein